MVAPVGVEASLSVGPEDTLYPRVWVGSDQLARVTFTDTTTGALIDPSGVLFLPIRPDGTEGIGVLAARITPGVWGAQIRFGIEGTWFVVAYCGAPARAVARIQVEAVQTDAPAIDAPRTVLLSNETSAIITVDGGVILTL